MNTICNDTDERQTDARSLAHEVDAVVVVGGKNSANTRHLAEICREIQPRTWHVETEAEPSPSGSTAAGSSGCLPSLDARLGDRGRGELAARTASAGHA